MASGVIPCPTPNCPGRVIRVVCDGALEWSHGGEQWGFAWCPQSHYQLFCSEAAAHSQRPIEGLFHWHELPGKVRQMLGAYQGSRA